MSVSGFYPTSVIGHLRAPGQVIIWNTGRPDPSGWRQWESGVYRPSAKIGWAGGFQAQKESGVVIDFGDIYADDAGFYTNTACLTFNLGEVNNNKNSFFNIPNTIGTGFKAYNMRFWIENSGAFNGYSPKFYFKTYRTWQGNFNLRSTTPGVQEVPHSLPSSYNIQAKANTIFVSGTYLEVEFSHFIYVVGKFPAGSYTLGKYGGLGIGNFKFRMTYDYTDIGARVYPADV